MNVVGSYNIIEHAETVSLFGFIKPMTPTFPVPLKLEQELLFLATVGDVPDAARDMVSICSGHKIQLLYVLFLRRHFWRIKWAIQGIKTGVSRVFSI